MPRRIAIALVCTWLTTSAAVGQTAWPVEAPPAPLAGRDVKFPPYEVRTLPNGLRVVAVLHHEQPVVSMRLIVRAGTSQDPRGKLGLAGLAASLLDQGTTTQSARQLNEQIDFIGAALGAGAGPDLTFVSLVAMKDSFDVGLGLLSDVVRHPAFAQEEIERQRQQAISALQVNLQDPEFVADAVFNCLVYGFHPYGLPDLGTPDTLAAVTRADLVAFHRRNFVPNNAILAIVGDVTAAEAFSGAARAFGAWARGVVSPPAAHALPDPTRRVIVVDKPGAVQTEIRVGQLGVRRNHPDFTALDLVIRILGGEGANRLQQLLRTERGLTYGAQADMDTFLESGDFEAETNTRTSATVEVLRLVLGEFSRLQRDRIGGRELGDAKAYLTGSFPLTIETPDAIALQVLNVLFYDLPIEELQSFRDRVNAIAVADAERVARTYLQPDRLSVVLVGDADSFVPQLTAAGFGPFEVVGVEDLDLLSPDFRRHATGTTSGAGVGGGVSGAGRTPVTRRARGRVGSMPGRQDGPDGLRTERVAYRGTQSVQRSEGPLTSRELLAKVVAAKGGLDRLRSIRTLEATTHVASANADVTTSLQYPNQVRVETKLPRETRLEVYDGSRGWVRDAQGVHEVPAAALRDLERTFQRDTIAMLLAASDGSLTVRRLPDIKLTGDDRARVYHALEMSSPSLEPTVLYIDPSTFLIAKQVYVANGPGRPVIEETFDDYREIEGVQIAFGATIRSGGQQLYERRLTGIEINPEFGAAQFAKPTP